MSWSEFAAGTTQAQPLLVSEASPHLFLCEIPISIFMKVSEAKERQGSCHGPNQNHGCQDSNERCFHRCTLHCDSNADAETACTRSARDHHPVPSARLFLNNPENWPASRCCPGCKPSSPPNGVEWVWRGYNFGYKKPILAFSGEMEFS